MAAFALRYPDQPTPKTERIIKEKLLAGLPSAKAELGHCLGDEYPLDNSLDLFENAMHRTKPEQGRPVWKVTPDSQPTGTSASASEASNQTDLRKLEQKVDQLLEGMKRSTRVLIPRGTWCPLLQVWRPLSERLSARSSSGCLL